MLTRCLAIPSLSSALSMCRAAMFYLRLHRVSKTLASRPIGRAGPDRPIGLEGSSSSLPSLSTRRARPEDLPRRLALLPGARTEPGGENRPVVQPLLSQTWGAIGEIHADRRRRGQSAAEILSPRLSLGEAGIGSLRSAAPCCHLQTLMGNNNLRRRVRQPVTRSIYLRVLASICSRTLSNLFVLRM
jgi:hypothetical protein